MICGIDLGSRCVKIVTFQDGKMAHSQIMGTAEFYRLYGEASPEGLKVRFADLGLAGIRKVVATGYGRNTLQIAGATVVPELKAHMAGAVWQTGLEDFTLLDLGGQDSKVVKVRKGKMTDFETNDKCAASTGRYLENMAQVLQISLEELSECEERPVELSATCAIFGESELIGRMVEGYSVAELAAGVNYSIIKRIKPMLAGMKSEVIVFTGGVAIGRALRHMLERETGSRIVVPEHPQLNGAIGCAALGAGKRGHHATGD